MDLLFGLRVRVWPLTTAIWEQAAARARRLGLEMGGHAEAIETAGGKISGLPNLTDPDARAGLSQMLFVVALAQCAIFEWEGAGDADGNAIPPSDDAIATLMSGFPAIADQFVTKYTAAQAEAVAEGKGSGISPAGTSAEVPDTARGAETRISPAAEVRQ
ncbi:MAG: hypothetical protein ACRC67_18295 [Inquilinus sp.]|uniref:hypothetical protein n=1 Tax=Inquilinus sp. TaxID=1932117 RepID=UPI003F302E5A